MKIAYFDCSSGASGDMVIASFLDAGFPLAALKKELNKLRVKGYSIRTETVKRHHLAATRIEFRSAVPASHFSVREIRRIIAASALNSAVKDRAQKIFSCIAAAEARVHKTGDIHLHELGSLDTILDIVGVAVCIDRMGIEKVYFSDLNLGRGIIRGHAMLPLPAPATLEILRGLPVTVKPIDGELITPTGAGILRTVGEYVESLPFVPDRVGYGAGTQEFTELPGVLRVIIGRQTDAYERDSVTVIECAIDDTMPIMYTYLYERLFEMGALDVYVAGILMKKTRPGHLLTVIVPHELFYTASEWLFRETGTSGIRHYRVERLKLARTFKKVRTAYGTITVKMFGGRNSMYKAQPEFESCRLAARKAEVPFMKVYEAAKKALPLVFMGLFLCVSYAVADTVYCKDGRELKGIIVEEYRDRVILSQEDGEKALSKDIIRSIDYDLEEQNLVSMADASLRAGDYDRAYYYYEKAKAVNPSYKDAIAGSNYLSGYIMRRASSKKLAQIQWSQTVEDFNKEKRKEGASVPKIVDLVGLELAEDTSHRIVVKKIYEGTPADRAGIAEGDAIASVWGKLTGYMRLDDVTALFTRGENLELKVQVDRKLKVEPKVILPSQLSLVFDGLTLKAVREESQAYQDGFRDGDVILAIDGKNIRYTPQAEIERTLAEGPHVLVIRRELTIWRSEKG
ncbi:MAG: nickel pincer cofactor biosynthesis protein LarC [Candidatus Omnitrophica bacterium]|nr:nickel pincer cofactor biosynthesis protein LarC [Candidatus Omnitrophota bacterium]